MNTYAKWFGRVVWLGIIANLIVALPTLLLPAETMAALSVPPAYPLLWPSFSALALILLSLFYVAAARGPHSNLLVSWLTVFARLAGVIFFLGFHRDYYLLGLFDLTFFIPEALLLLLVIRAQRDALPESPFITKGPRIGAKLRLAAIALLTLLTIGGIITYLQFFREVPPPYFASDEEHFLYGSIGTESTSGVPYWLWLVLPRVFPDKLPHPGGYAALGLVFEEGKELPVGFSKQKIGIDRVAINCAFCHAGSYRTNANLRPAVVAGAPGSTQAPQAYLRFLFDCASDPRFNANTLMAEIAKNYRLGPLDKITYRLLIPFVKFTLLSQKNEYAQYGLLHSLPLAGNGRIDPFNLVKYRYLKQTPDGSMGNADMEPLWNFKAHQGYSLHWDGLNTSLQEVVLSSAIGDGTPLQWVNNDFLKSDRESSLKRITNYINNAQAPKYPFSIDRALSDKGKDVYDRECAQCHAPGGQRTGKVEPIDNPMLATDRNRIDMWTQSAATAYNQYTSQYDWKFSHFGKQSGYVNVTLEGLWLRAPYLHNGSVPSLADLLRKPEQRPKVFYRGYDVVDAENVGFVSQGSEAECYGFRFDTAEHGNSNAGHLWGTDLDSDQKKQLIEYLKTL